MNLKYLIYLIACGINQIHADYTDMVDKITKDILTSYKKDVRPTGNVSDSGIAVGINVVPLHVHVNSDTSTLSSHVWFVMRWEDTRLKWVPTNYDNISMIHLGPEKVWKPDIMVFNSVQHYDYENTDIVVTSKGELWWVPPANLLTSCELDWTYWPWDYQSCTLSVGSWTRAGWDVDIRTMNGANVTGLDKLNFVAGAWDLVGGSQRRRNMLEYGSDGQYVELTVSFLLQRRSFLDKKVAVLPLLVSCCLILAIFWIHPASANRLRLNIAACIILVITILALRSFLPSAGGQLPMVVAMGTGLVVLAMIQLMLILSLFNLVARVDIPSSRLLVPLQTLAPFLCLGTIPLIGQVPSSIVPPWNRTGPDAENLQPEQPKLKGWNLIAQAVDRLSFVVYLIVVFLFLVTYIGAATTSYNNKMQNGVSGA